MAVHELTLAAHCTALLCRHLPEVLDQCGHLLPTLPLATRAALLASLRRRAPAFDRLAGNDACTEIDRCVLALTSENQTVLDLAGLRVSDTAAAVLAPRLTRVRALDVRRCPLLTALGLRLLLVQATELRVLRWGGCAASDRAARGALASLLPQLRHSHDLESSWELMPLATAKQATICAPMLQFLAWPEADERSAGRIARCCPRIRLLQSQSIDNATQPLEADIAVALDAPALQALSPLVLDDASGSVPATFVPQHSTVGQQSSQRPHIAELFRLAYEARDLRLAPKRAKNARQRERREKARTLNAVTRLGGTALAALHRANLLPPGDMAGLCICDM